MSTGLHIRRVLMVLAFALERSGPAWTSDWDPPSVKLTLTSDYRFRGLSQDDRLITPQVEVDWNGPDDWSLGLLASKVNFKDHENTSVELDLLLDKRFDLSGTSLDLGAYYYAYPNHDPADGHPRYSTFEADGSLSRDWGSVTFTGTAAWSPNYLANGVSWYASLGASYPVSSWLRVDAHVGRQWARRLDENSMAGYPYAHWDVGTTVTWRQASFDLRLVGTSLSRAQCALAVGGDSWCETALMVSVVDAFNASNSSENPE